MTTVRRQTRYRPYRGTDAYPSMAEAYYEGPSTSSGAHFVPEEVMNSSSNNNGARPPLKLQCIEKIHSIPLFEMVISSVGEYYNRLKRINPVAEWSLDVAEGKLYSIAEFSLASPLKFPLKLADSVFCYSINFVENRIPVIKRQPEEIIPTVRKMVSDKAEAITHPVVSRANSFKKVATDFGFQKADQAIGTRVGTLTARNIIAACNYAENLIETYLPDPDNRQQQQQEGNKEERRQGDARYTVGRLDNVTRTLSRRLTKRTLNRASSIKQSIADPISNMVSILTSFLTNPKSGWDYVANVWYEMSLDEPENQPPPETLGQVTGLILRECTRQVIHLINALSVWPLAALNWLSRQFHSFYRSLRLDAIVNFANQQMSSATERIEVFISQFVGRIPQN